MPDLFLVFLKVIFIFFHFVSIGVVLGFDLLVFESLLEHGLRKVVDLAILLIKQQTV